jgi:hypothetical protein
MLAPAATSFFTTGALSSGTKPFMPGVPAVFGTPATWMLSLITAIPVAGARGYSNCVV